MSDEVRYQNVQNNCLASSLQQAHRVLRPNELNLQENFTIQNLIDAALQLSKEIRFSNFQSAQFIFFYQIKACCQQQLPKFANNQMPTKMLMLAAGYTLTARTGFSHLVNSLLDFRI